jgi:hypothetical protein
MQVIGFGDKDDAAKWAASMNERFGNQPVRPHAMKFAKDGLLSEAAKFLDATDPLRGSNVLRHAGIVDNGNGTLTFRRHIPYRPK